MCNFRHVPICKAGRLLGETKGDISTAYTYNNAGWLTSKSNTSNGQTTTYALTYFSDGNIASRAENGVTTNYTYDNLGQLVKENDTTYEYDTRGNRIKRTYGEVVTDYRYDRTNKLMTQNTGDLWTAYAYDENGNNTLRETYEQITENGTTSQNPVEYLAMTYDPLNRLTKAQSEGMTAEYTYGIDNMRTTKTVNGVTTKYAWDRGNIAYERDPGTLSTTYYHYGIGLVASRIINDATFYQTNDHGDVTAWGDVAYSYDAFGNEKTESTGENNFRYSGEYYDEETGFIYLRNRYYDPSTGRFINEDPIKDGLNWYVYCSNNPIRYVDPSGMYYLVKDEQGQVYAVIESEDTLSAISYSEVRDSNAYLNLNYAEAGMLEVGQYVNITGIYNNEYPIPTNIMLSKTAHTQGDSGLRDVSDEEVSRRARDRSLSGEERRRYQREEKIRGQRNKQKRQNHYNKDVSSNSSKPAISTTPAMTPQNSFGTSISTPAYSPGVPIDAVDNEEQLSFWGEAAAGVITAVGIFGGILYLVNSGDASMLYQFVQ